MYTIEQEKKKIEEKTKIHRKIRDDGYANETYKINENMTFTCY